ncbi:MAG TPA: cell wall hydrolase [Thermoanaerobaculia bacterium]|nr:cell wall hydrolase [Thermoanaerobaculia bacterium]
MRAEAEWLALCLASESNEPREWPLIAWVIRNRVESARYPETYRGVVLQPKQFSYFNALTAGPENRSLELIWTEAMKGYAGDIYRRHSEELTACARAVIQAPNWRRPFGPDVMHYYSPISMKPRGSAPAWAPKAKRLFTPSGIDPQRFVFAAGVP